jgi:hypothetical protein
MVRFKFIFGIAVILFFFSSVNAQELLKSKYDKSTFTFEFTFENDNDYPVFINEVGGICQVNLGNFNCEPRLWLPNPLSDFVVNVPAQSDTVFITARPIIQMQPGEVKTFTMSVVPDAAKACDVFAIDIAALVKFHYGYTFQSAPELVMSQDVERMSLQVYTDEELQQMINDYDAVTRIKAIEGLKFSSIDKGVIETLLAKKVKDKDIEVRKASAIAVKDMRLNSLGDVVTANLFSTNDSEEIKVLISVLGRLKHSGAIDPMIGRLMNSDIESSRLVTKALIEMENQEAASKARYVFQRQKAWAKGDEIEREKIGLIASILINYKDMSSVEQLKAMLDDPNTAPAVKYDILSNMAGLLPSIKVVKDEFITSFGDEYASNLGNEDDMARYNALNLYMASNTDDKSKSKVIKRSLKDSQLQIKCRAAVWAGELGYEEYASEIQNLVNIAQPGIEYDEMAAALIKLK